MHNKEYILVKLYLFLYFGGLLHRLDDHVYFTVWIFLYKYVPFEIDYISKKIRRPNVL